MANLARWQRHIVDAFGNVIPLAAVEVRRESDNALASLFSDRTGLSGITNPFNADATGFAAFHATGDSYKITATSGALSVTWRYVGVGLAQETDSAGGSSAAPLQRFVNSSPITIGVNDVILNCNIATGSPGSPNTCALPASASRSGGQLIFKDVGGQFAAHPLRITPNGAETIDGLASITLATNRMMLRIRALNDGTNSGWLIEQ